MIFPYWEEVRDDELHLLPIIPVTVRFQNHTIDSYALIDSGAEQSIFPLEAAEDLEYDVSKLTNVTIVGAGGKYTSGKLGTIEYQLGRYHWTAPIIFSSAINERPLLGQIGFFAFFTITFRHNRRRIEIKRPRVSHTPNWHQKI